MGKRQNAEPTDAGLANAQPKPPRAPNDSERAAIATARAAQAERPAPLRYKVTSTTEDTPFSIKAPHSDPGGHAAHLRETFGTASPEFAGHGMGWVGMLMSPRCSDPTQESDLNTGIAVVAGVAPQNETEAMLAIQMLGTHEFALSMLTRAQKSENIEAVERYANIATKFMRTYTTQLETLSKLRRGGEQTMRVEHVHVHRGGQAIVGQVGSSRGQGAANFENGTQPHALTGTATLALPASTPMLCQDEGGPGMPVAGGEGQGAVPDARRSRRQRRAKR